VIATIRVDSGEVQAKVANLTDKWNQELVLFCRENLVNGGRSVILRDRFSRGEALCLGQAK